MNIQIASDLHLDQLSSSFKYKELIVPVSDILVLCGDICHIVTLNKYKDFFDYLNKNFQYIIYVPGNHEFYNKKSMKIDELTKTIKEFLKNYNKFIYLDNQSVLIEDILFTGSCLWCKPNVNPPPWFHIDITKEEINNMNNESINYLEKVSSLKYEKHIIITHYPPIYLRNLNKYTEYDDYYINQNIELDHYPKYWFFGHTHKNFYKTINNTTYISNQRKDKQFKKSFIITL